MKPIEITDFKKTPGEYLKNPALEKFGISIAYLDEETYDEKGASLILESMGMDKKTDGATHGGSKAAVGILKAMFQLPGVTVLMIKDPDNKFLRIEGAAGDGEAAFHSQSAIEGLWMLHRTRGDAELAVIRIHVKSKQAEFTTEFVIRDVKLP